MAALKTHGDKKAMTEVLDFFSLQMLTDKKDIPHDTMCRVIKATLEYNTFSRKLGANVLFTYRVNSGTVFFVGYDDRYQQGDLILDMDNNLAHHQNQRFFTTDLLRTNRAFFTKISYLFRY